MFWKGHHKIICASCVRKRNVVVHCSFRRYVISKGIFFQGTYVAKTFAFDDDATKPNNETVYRIESGGLDKFRINAETGVITVIEGSSLDRDVFETQYSLSILAIDRGTPPRSGQYSLSS